jgi:tricorn protease
MDDLFSHLAHTADKQIELTVNSKPSMAGSRKVIVIPIADESALYYFNWVQKNIEYVNSKTGGAVGYLHIPDMGPGGLNEFMKHFYPQISKQALIVDVRGNGGGFVSGLVAERLSRQLIYFNITRYSTGTPDPAMILGPQVLLADQYSASDGDIIAHRFKKYGLGKVIGRRTWGGVVGIRGTLPLIDGGFINRPEFASYDETGWPIEGTGVEPDIVVDQDPALEFKGIDQQLDKGIEVILEELKTKGRQVPKIPPPPDKTKPNP